MSEKVREAKDAIHAISNIVWNATTEPFLLIKHHSEKAESLLTALAEKPAERPADLEMVDWGLKLADERLMKLSVSSQEDELRQCLQIILTNAGNIKDDRDGPILEECDAIEAAVERAKNIEWPKRAERPQLSAEPFAYVCPTNCGCMWRDNHDGTMSLFGKSSQSCEVCEPLPLDKLKPVFALLTGEAKKKVPPTGNTCRVCRKSIPSGCVLCDTCPAPAAPPVLQAPPEDVKREYFKRGREWELAEFKRHLLHLPRIPGVCSWCRESEVSESAIRREAEQQGRVTLCANLLYDYFTAMAKGEDFDWVEKLRALADSPVSGEGKTE